MIQDDVVAAVAMELFVRHGVRKASIEDVAQRCATTRMTLYRRYGSKQQLLEFAIGHTLRAIDDNTAMLVRREFRSVAEMLSAVHDAYDSIAPEGVTGLLDELSTVAPELRARVVDQQKRTAASLTDRLLEIAEREHGLASDISPALRHAWADLAVDRLATLADDRLCNLSPAEVFRQVARLLLYGLVDAPGGRGGE